MIAFITTCIKHYKETRILHLITASKFLGRYNMKISSFTLKNGCINLERNKNLKYSGDLAVTVIPKSEFTSMLMSTLMLKDPSLPGLLKSTVVTSIACLYHCRCSRRSKVATAKYFGFKLLPQSPLDCRSSRICPGITEILASRTRVSC